MNDDKTEAAWQKWWDEEGSGMRPLEGHDHEEHARRMTNIAWHNGAYAERHPPKPPKKKERVLYLSVKKKWFDQMLDGSKTEEYRLVTPYWEKRLVDSEYDYIVISNGYPKKADYHKRLRFAWNGCWRQSLVHEEWNKVPQEVFTIPLHVLKLP